jgi:hypothetical protein
MRTWTWFVEGVYAATEAALSTTAVVAAVGVVDAAVVLEEVLAPTTWVVAVVEGVAGVPLSLVVPVGSWATAVLVAAAAVVVTARAVASTRDYSRPWVGETTRYSLAGAADAVDAVAAGPCGIGVKPRARALWISRAIRLRIFEAWVVCVSSLCVCLCVCISVYLFLCFSAVFGVKSGARNEWNGPDWNFA